jgi:hypothetical protein
MTSAYIMYTLVLMGAAVTGAYFRAEYAGWRRLRGQELRKYGVGRDSRVHNS